MQKIKSLFKRDWNGNRQATPEIEPGSEWVQLGEGVATEKFDGSACMIRDGVFYQRFDRKVKNGAKRRGPPYTAVDSKPAPPGWEPCAPDPDEISGHWPGWVPVDEADPSAKYHMEAFHLLRVDTTPDGLLNGTYELIGPKLQGNPYNETFHSLVKHGNMCLPNVPRTFHELKEWFSRWIIEGIVWHHPDGRMVKVKRKDFGYKWPAELAAKAKE